MPRKEDLPDRGNSFRPLTVEETYKVAGGILPGDLRAIIKPVNGDRDALESFDGDIIKPVNGDIINSRRIR